MPPIIDRESKILILGTMPGERSLGHQQYYANNGNHFWKLLYAVFGEEFSTDYAKRLEFLHRHHIALWDVLSHCEREGSLDSAIKNEVANDFDAFFSLYPSISHVFFSSKNAAKYFDRHATRRDGITFQTLPSPSGANASMRFEEKLAYWKVLRAIVGN